MHPNTLADRFERNRARLGTVAFRILGSWSEADDAVQETWLRLARTETDGVRNVDAWLTTVVGRVCLDALRSQSARREVELDRDHTAPHDPSSEAMLAGETGTAMMVVLDALAPAERVAFVLHDLFDVAFEDIAALLDRSNEAVRQLASRARRRVRGADAPEPDPNRQRLLVDAFRRASREGDLPGLLAVLAPDVVVRADAGAIALGAPAETRSAGAVAEMFKGQARAAKRTILEGTPGIAWIVAGDPRVVFHFGFEDGRIASIDLIGDRDAISTMALEVLS